MIGKGVQDLWADAERSKASCPETFLQVLLDVMISNIHNLELYEDQSTGKPGNQSQRKQANRKPFYGWSFENPYISIFLNCYLFS